MDYWNKLSFLPREDLKRIQNKKLRDFVNNHLYPFSPYYRTLFDRYNINPKRIKTVEDLKVIPFTRKEDFLPHGASPHGFMDFILQPDKALIKKYWPKTRLFKLGILKLLKGKGYIKARLDKEYRPIFLTATTGTTHDPVSFLYTDYDINNLRISGYRLLEVFKAKSQIRAVNLFPYAPHLAFWQTVFAGLTHDNFVLSTGGGKVMGTHGNIDAIKKVNPDVLIGVPSYLYHVARSAKEMKMHLDSVQKVILGAVAVPAGFKEKLASLLKSMGAKHVRIMGTYGFTEAKCAWGECPTPIKLSSGYHTYPDKEIFEIIDPDTGEVRGEGEDGELVYTAIDARGSCVLRYRTGDLVKGGITYKKCPYCRRTVPRISSDISRVSNIKNLMVSKIKGTLVNLNMFSEILESEKKVDEWQIEIRKKDNDLYEIDELIVYVSLAGDMDHQAVKENLNSRIQGATELVPNKIIILPHKEMLGRIEIETSNKVRRIVDLRLKC